MAYPVDESRTYSTSLQSTEIHGPRGQRFFCSKELKAESKFSLLSNCMRSQLLTFILSMIVKYINIIIQETGNKRGNEFQR